MTEKEKIYPTSLGDYLSMIASKKDILKSDLEKVIEIECVTETTFEKINKESMKYDAIVDVRVATNTIGWIFPKVYIYGTGVQLNLDKIK